MRISDELIASYVDGTASTETRNIVRNYLHEHPEEYERVLCLIDKDTEDYLAERIEVVNDCLHMDESSFSDIAYSAAAFAPQQKKPFSPKHKSKLSKIEGIYDRLSRMSNELDDIL